MEKFLNDLSNELNKDVTAIEFNSVIPSDSGYVLVVDGKRTKVLIKQELLRDLKLNIPETAYTELKTMILEQLTK